MKIKILLLVFFTVSLCHAQENYKISLDSTQITLIGNKLYKAYQGYNSEDGSTSIKYSEVDLSNVLFKTSQSILRSDSYNPLNALVILLRDNPTIELVINGHTDKIGHPRSNLKLSIRRARTIKLYLFNKGIKLDRITANGFGDQSPICNSPCKDNQRVEFTLLLDQNEKKLVSRKTNRIFLENNKK